MIEDTYVNMLVKQRNKLNISTKSLCEGVYDEDMFYLAEQGKRTMDRVTAKRLLARLGVDNGDYEHYLDYPDYEAWKRRMQIINYIEQGDIKNAKHLLEKYQNYVYSVNKKNTSREKIENQFYLFIKSQIARYCEEKLHNDIAMSLCEEALKLTVPYIDEKSLDEIMLSPLEFNLVLEYKSKRNKYKTVKELMDMYINMLSYIDNAPYGKVSQAKVYPKTVTYMYRDVVAFLESMKVENNQDIYISLLEYVEKALNLLKDRKLLFYMTEILEIKKDILMWFCNNTDTEKIEEFCKEKDKIVSQLNELKNTYLIYDEEPYMRNDCYLYRESGIYCTNEVIKIRRKMFNISQEKLAGNEVSVGTIKRTENEKKPMKKETVKKLFSKLHMYPDCVNWGIVAEEKDVVELYEELRCAIISFDSYEVEKIIDKLKNCISEHPINKQVLLRVESLNKWRREEITAEQYLSNLQEALECTIGLSSIQDADEIFITTEELMTLYLISDTYKQIGQYDKAIYYINEIWRYCEDIEKNDLVEGRMGIYELIMEYMGSLYGDMGRYEDSNNISHKLIKKSLQQRRGGQIHSNIYNIAWNNNESNKNEFDFNRDLCRCIKLSQLMGDVNYTIFYNQKLTDELQNLC